MLIGALGFVKRERGELEREREREKYLYFVSLARLWAYGGCLKCNKSLRLHGVYLVGLRRLYLWNYGTINYVHQLLCAVLFSFSSRARKIPNANEIALSRVPILQRLPLLHGCQVHPPRPVAFEVCCTIAAVYKSLRVSVHKLNG